MFRRSNWASALNELLEAAGFQPEAEQHEANSLLQSAKAADDSYSSPLFVSF